MGIYAVFDHRHCCKYPDVRINPNEVQDLSSITLSKTKPRLLFPFFQDECNLLLSFLSVFVYPLLYIQIYALEFGRNMDPCIIHQHLLPLPITPASEKECIIAQYSIHNPNCCPQSKCRLKVKS